MTANHAVYPDMLDDGYWSGFSSDFSDYEIGPTIGMYFFTGLMPSLSSPCFRFRCILNSVYGRLQALLNSSRS